MKITIKTQRGGGDIEVWLNDRLACGIAAGGETVPPGWADTSTEVGRLENFASKQFRYELSLRLPLVKERNAAARYAPHWASNMMGHWEGELSILRRFINHTYTPSRSGHPAAGNHHDRKTADGQAGAVR